MRIVLAYQNTKKKNLDFAITPYLFFVDSQQCKKTREPEYAGHGIGLCWGWHAIALVFWWRNKGKPIFINTTK